MTRLLSFYSLDTYSHGVRHRTKDGPCQMRSPKYSFNFVVRNMVPIFRQIRLSYIWPLNKTRQNSIGATLVLLMNTLRIFVIWGLVVNNYRECYVLGPVQNVILPLVFSFESMDYNTLFNCNCLTSFWFTQWLHQFHWATGHHLDVNKRYLSILTTCGNTRLQALFIFIHLGVHRYANESLSPTNIVLCPLNNQCTAINKLFCKFTNSTLDSHMKTILHSGWIKQVKGINMWQNKSNLWLADVRDDMWNYVWTEPSWQGATSSYCWVSPWTQMSPWMWIGRLELGTYIVGLVQIVTTVRFLKRNYNLDSDCDKNDDSYNVKQYSRW